MLNFIDKLLNKITMYRLVLYFLLALVVVGVVLSALGILGFRPLDLIFSTLILVVICGLVNKIFAQIFQVPANVESVYITALILALIITPPNVTSPAYFSGLGFLFWAGVWAMACKYILAWRGKHIFNPAAFAVALTALTINQSASWWVGTLWMLPFVVAGGLLVTKKIQRFDLVFSFFAVALVAIVGSSIARSNITTIMYRALVDSPILFFGFIMLTEPLTTPPTKISRTAYGALVGFLFAPAFHIGSLYTTPELALLAGNVFSYCASPKIKYLLSFQSKELTGSDIYNFVFRLKYRLKFRPGQYLEWTLGHNHPDSRGNRRYFTIASSPTENKIHLGVKFYDNPSTFKQTLLGLRPGNQILAGQLAGEFTMPDDPKIKLAFIAGGIGVTPFRSMIKYLLDRKEPRSITLFYSNNNFSQVAYEDIFDQAHRQLGIKTVYISTDTQGRLTPEIIKTETPDYMQRIFYISGPRSMVTAFEKTLKSMGVPKPRIKIDFFPGLV